MIYAKITQLRKIKYEFILIYRIKFFFELIKSNVLASKKF